MEQQGRERINWRPIIILFLIGLALMAGALLATSPGDLALIDWLGVAEGGLVNIGTAFLVAGLLFFAERRFVRRVEAVSRDAAASAIAKSEARVYARVNARLDDIERQVRERIASDTAREVALVALPDLECS